MLLYCCFAVRSCIVCEFTFVATLFCIVCTFKLLAHAVASSVIFWIFQVKFANLHLVFAACWCIVYEFAFLPHVFDCFPHLPCLPSVSYVGLVFPKTMHDIPLFKKSCVTFFVAKFSVFSFFFVTYLNQFFF